jgi:hypothetical protein
MCCDLVPTYSYHSTITIVQALVASMKVPSRANISCPPLGCFGDHWSRVFGKRMKRRETISENEKQQSANVGGKCE